MSRKVLFVHPRRGLFQLTSCQDCGHTFSCENCDSKLTTYRENANTLELVCNHCQTYYQYPKTCPNCHGINIFSAYGGIDDLAEKLGAELHVKINRFDAKKKEVDTAVHNPNSLYKKYDGEIYLTTRIFDPQIDYSIFDQIVFVQAENLTANLDYLATEDVLKNLTEVFTSAKDNCEILFDTNVPGLDFFKEIIRIHPLNSETLKYKNWFLNEINKESNLRQTFHFPPFDNLLLVTSQEKNRQTAIDAINHFKKNLAHYKEKIPDITISSPYPARVLRRKNMYSYHVLIKYPKQYKHFSNLREIVTDLANTYKLQTRLNPHNLF